MKAHLNLKKLLLPNLLSLPFLMMGCATSSIEYKTKFVPVDIPRVVCGGAKIESSFKDPVDLASSEIPNVTTNDEVVLLAKAAMDDVVLLDQSHANLVREVNKLEARCAKEEAEVEKFRIITLGEINALNTK